MNTEAPSILVALTGGSGAGKTWLTARLCQELGEEAAALSLDNFFCDLSHLTMAEREQTNFDHPNAIDWPLFEGVLRDLQFGVTVLVPRYDFVSHTRSPEWKPLRPRPFTIVEGLWLLWLPHVREVFDFRVYLDCVQSLRLERRLVRDHNERGRTTNSIRKQFRTLVAPMHERFVQVQKPWADFVLEQSITRAELGRFTASIRALRIKPRPMPQAAAPPAL